MSTTVVVGPGGRSRLTRTKNWPQAGWFRRGRLRRVRYVRAAACPRSGCMGRYRRQLRDTALFGVPVVVRLRIRRFVCGNSGCAAPGRGSRSKSGILRLAGAWLAAWRLACCQADMAAIVTGRELSRFVAGHAMHVSIFSIDFTDGLGLPTVCWRHATRG